MSCEYFAQVVPLSMLYSILEISPTKVSSSSFMAKLVVEMATPSKISIVNTSLDPEIFTLMSFWAVMLFNCS